MADPVFRQHLAELPSFYPATTTGGAGKGNRLAMTGSASGTLDPTLLGGAPTFSKVTVSGFVTSFVSNDTSGAANRKRWAMLSAFGDWILQFRNDDDTSRVDCVKISAADNSVTVTGNLLSYFDSTLNVGSASNRFNTIYASNTAISSSDARLKTPVKGLSAAEGAWALDMAREIGAWRWLAKVVDEGDAARLHVGLTVQRAVEMAQAHGLDAMRYSFICHDRWDAIPETPAIMEPVLDEQGQPTGEERIAIEAKPARPAGDLYSFRLGELAMFIAGAQQRVADDREARLAAIEAKLA